MEGTKQMMWKGGNKGIGRMEGRERGNGITSGGEDVESLSF